MQKIVIIINGYGESGKDTRCNFVSEEYKTLNVSAIDPIKTAANILGWDGNKDDISRKYLSDLKQLSIKYNNYPFKYLIGQYQYFKKSDDEVMFVHIREAEEIDKFKEYVELPCATLLINRKSQQKHFGNESDDNVKNYPYDYIYNYDYGYDEESLKESKKDFLIFFKQMVEEVISH